MTYQLLDQTPRALGSYNRGGAGGTFEASIAPARRSEGTIGSYFVWRVGENTNAAGATDRIFFQKINIEGRLSGSPVLVTERNWSQIAPEVRWTWLRNGRIAVVWRAKAPDAGGTDDGGLTGLVARVYSRAGIAESAEFQITTETVPAGQMFDVTGTVDEGFVVVWSDGTSVRSVKVDKNRIVQTPLTVATPVSPPLHVTAATMDVYFGVGSSGMEMVIGWTVNDGGVRCFLQQLAVDYTLATPSGEAISPFTPSPLEVGIAAAGNSEVWITATQSLRYIVTRGEGATYRSYEVDAATSWQSAAVARGYTLWTGVTSLPLPPMLSDLQLSYPAGTSYPSGVSYFSGSARTLIISGLSSTDGTGNPWPNGVSRGFLRQINYVTGATHIRIDPDFPAEYASGTPVPITMDYNRIMVAALPTYPATVAGSPTAMEITGFVDPEPLSVTDPGGPTYDGPEEEIFGIAEGTTGIVNWMQVISLPGHPTASGLAFWQSGSTVRAVHLDANGAKIGSPTTLTTNSGSARVVATNDGGFVLGLENAGAFTLQLIRFDATMTAGPTLNLTAIRRPGFEVTSDDRLVIAGGRQTLGGGDYHIYNATTFAPITTNLTFDAGNTTNSPPSSGNRIGYVIYGASVTALSSGRFVIWWTRSYDIVNATRWERLHFGIYDSSGILQGTVRLAANFSRGGIFDTRRLNNGGFAACLWDSFANQSYRMIYFDDNGDRTNEWFLPAHNERSLAYAWRPAINPNDGSVTMHQNTFGPAFLVAFDQYGNVRGRTPLPDSADGILRTGTILFRRRVENGVGSVPYMVLGFLNNGKLVAMGNLDVYNGTTDDHIMVAQTFTLTGNPPNANTGLLRYDDTSFTQPTFPSGEALWSNIGIARRGSAGGAVAAIRNDSLNEYLFTALNPCCDPVGSPVTISPQNHVVAPGGSFAGFNNGDFVVAAGYYWLSGTADDGNGYFWRWSVNETTNAVTAVDTRVQFHQATANHWAHEARVAPLADGGFAIAWVNAFRSSWWGGGAGSASEPILSIRFFNANGTARTASLVVDGREDTANGRELGSGNENFYGPAVSLLPLPNGNIAVAWDVFDLGNDTDAATWMRVYQPDGTPVTGILPVNLGFSTPVTNEQLSGIHLIDGKIRVFWRYLGIDWDSYDSQGGIGLYRDFDFNLNALTPPLTTLSLYDETSKVAVLPDGSIINPSTQNELDPYGPTRVWNQPLMVRWSADGTQRIGEVFFFSNTAGTGFEMYFDVLANGNLAVMWQGASPDNDGPYVQFFAVDGNSIPTCGGLTPIGPVVRLIWFH